MLLMKRKRSAEHTPQAEPAIPNRPHADKISPNCKGHAGCLPPAPAPAARLSMARSKLAHIIVSQRQIVASRHKLAVALDDGLQQLDRLSELALLQQKASLSCSAIPRRALILTKERADPAQIGAAPSSPPYPLGSGLPHPLPNTAAERRLCLFILLHIGIIISHIKIAFCH